MILIAQVIGSEWSGLVQTRVGQDDSNGLDRMMAMSFYFCCHLLCFVCRCVSAAYCTVTGQSKTSPSALTPNTGILIGKIMKTKPKTIIHNACMNKFKQQNNSTVVHLLFISYTLTEIQKNESYYWSFFPVSWCSAVLRLSGVSLLCWQLLPWVQSLERQTDSVMSRMMGRMGAAQ